MPAKKQIPREIILEAAVALVRKGGMGLLNARNLAKELHCSTQPIYLSFQSMEALKEEIIQKAQETYQAFLAQEGAQAKYPPYKAYGMGYIRFAKEEKELFRLLFMRDRSREIISGDPDEIADIVSLISKTTGLSRDAAYLFHIEMWIFVHGIATMIATSYLDWDLDTVSRVLTDDYQGLTHTFRTREDI